MGQNCCALHMRQQWAGFLIGEFARELACYCTTHNWNQLLRKLVPPSEMRGRGFAQKILLSLFIQSFRRRRMRLPGLLRDLTVSQQTLFFSETLNFYKCFSPFPMSIQGLPGTTLAILSLLLILHPCALTQHLYSASALTQGSKPTILYFWAIWAPGRKNFLLKSSIIFARPISGVNH